MYVYVYNHAELCVWSKGNSDGQERGQRTVTSCRFCREMWFNLRYVSGLTARPLTLHFHIGQQFGNGSIESSLKAVQT